ncbi:MAG: glycosyltransferase family 4 protein [Defluviitaleaceae bacterium]|nr:glycosyltransferase family 4 protein [Defluviitaleaceae bacterium]MCL2274442.1 glycosyltransferase family 4 protein [Defluviitaleaceae bacterium]
MSENLGVINKESELIDAASAFRYVCLYGAGNVGNLIVQRMNINAVKLHAVFVSDKEGNPDKLTGIPVCLVDEQTIKKENCLVIIGTIEQYHAAIIETLDTNGFKNMVPVNEILLEDMMLQQTGDLGKVYHPPNALTASPKLRVLFIASERYDTSGAFLSMKQLCHELNTICNISTIIALPILPVGNGEVQLIERGLSYALINAECWTMPINEVNNPISVKRKEKLLTKNESAVNDLCQIITNEKIDIVHINTSWTHVGALAAQKMNIPVVWHIREFLEEDQCMQILDKSNGYALINRSNAIITVSNAIAKKYENILCKQKLNVIYNGINANKFYMPDKTIMKNEQTNLLYLGAISPQKGFDLFIDACIILRKHNVNFCANVVGGGDSNYINAMKKKVQEESLSKYVIFHNLQANVEKFYRTADIFVMSSLSEAFGRTTAEAMMGGCLVIGTNDGATAELINHKQTGLLFAKGDANDLAKKIIYSINNISEASRIAYTGREYAYNNFSSTANTNAIAKIYDKIRGGL